MTTASCSLYSNAVLVISGLPDLANDIAVPYLVGSVVRIGTLDVGDRVGRS